MADIGIVASDTCLTQPTIVTSDFEQLNSSHQHDGSDHIGLGVDLSGGCGWVSNGQIKCQDWPFISGWQ
jgi:hypothetical protein